MHVHDTYLLHQCKDLLQTKARIYLALFKGLVARHNIQIYSIVADNYSRIMTMNFLIDLQPFPVRKHNMT